MPETLAKLLYHVIFCTKDRAPLILPVVQNELYPYMDGIVGQRKGAILAIGGMSDHVHILLRLRTYLPLAALMRSLKAGSSKWLNEQKGFQGAFAWQRGYGAFTVSESNAPAVKRYIQEQEAHHRRQSSRDELVRILQKHGIAFKINRLDD
jgi:putative transposase